MFSIRGSLRAPVLAVVALAIAVETPVAGRIAVANGFVAGFPPQTTRQLDDQWLFSGSAVSIPLPPVVALVVFVALAQLRPRWARIVGSIGCILLACLFVFASFGEPTFIHPVSAMEFLLQLLVFALAITLGLTAALSLRSAIRHHSEGVSPRRQVP